MSPAALELLTIAYENYLKTHDTFSSHLYNGDNVLSKMSGAEQLCDDGYIENVSDCVYAKTVWIEPFEPISFTLTSRGINYMRSSWKL